MASTFQPLTILNPGNRTREYVSGGFDRIVGPLIENAIQLLSQHQEPLNKEFTDSIYEEMMNDPAVSASVDILKSLILSESLRIVPRIKDKQDADYARAKEIADFVTDQFRQMDRSLHTILWEALEAIQYGSSLTEICYDNTATDAEGRPIWRLANLKTRSRKNYGLVVDRYFNLLGCVNKELGSTPSVYSGAIKPDKEAVIPRNKFLMITFHSRYGDPRGWPLIRPAYNAYYCKTQVWPQYVKFLVQFASPSLIGITPVDSYGEVEELDGNGNPIIGADGEVAVQTDEEQMLETLLGFQAGTVAVLKGGSTIEKIQSDSNGEAFSAAVDLFDRQIAMAILKTHRTLLESKHSSKADSESAADITDVYVSGLREVVADGITKDVIYQLVLINFGAEDAKKFAPGASLKAMPKQDFAKAAAAIATLKTSGFLHKSQFIETDQLIGLPDRDEAEWLNDLEEADNMERLDQVERMKLLNPGAGTTTPAEEELPDE